MESLQNDPIQYRPVPYVPFCMETFTSKSKYKNLQILKIILGAIFLLPVRFILLIISAISGYIFARLACYNKSEICGKKPDMPNSSYFFTVMLNRSVRLALFSIGLTDIEFTGKVPIDYDSDQPWLKYSVVAGPHSATFDWALVISKACRLLSPVIKGESGLHPFFKYICRPTMPLLVFRYNKESRKDCLENMIIRQKEGSEAGWFPVMNFVEGTNCNRKQFCTFKIGPFIAGQPLIPVIIKYPQDEDPNENDLVTWPHFGSSVPLKILMGMCRLQTTITYHFMDPYFPTEEEKKNPSLYAESVRQLMSKESKIPVSDWSFDDVKLMTISKNKGFIPEIGGIQFSKIFAGIKHGDQHAKDLIEKYLKILKKFAHFETKMMPVIEKDILLKEMFNLNEDGELINFDENVEKIVGYYKSVLPSYVSFEQLCKCYVKVLKKKFD